MRIALMAFIMAVVVFLIAISFRAVYYAFIKKKDERSKWIVIKSMADSFIGIIILQAIAFGIKLLNAQLWSNIKMTVYVEPALLSLIVLGVILIVNTKRHGGSL